MEIIKRGQLPQNKRYEATCSNCKTVFSFLAGEARASNNQFDGPALIVNCPLDGCAKECWVSPSEGRYGPG